MPAVITPGARKAMGNDAAFQILAKRPPHVRSRDPAPLENAIEFEQMLSVVVLAPRCDRRFANAEHCVAVEVQIFVAKDLSDERLIALRLDLEIQVSG